MSPQLLSEDRMGCTSTSQRTLAGDQASDPDESIELVDPSLDELLAYSFAATPFRIRGFALHLL